METDTETHVQTLGQTQIILLKRGKIGGTRGVNDIIRKATESTNLGSYELRESELTAREPAWD